VLNAKAVQAKAMAAAALAAATSRATGDMGGNAENPTHHSPRCYQLRAVDGEEVQGWLTALEQRVSIASAVGLDDVDFSADAFLTSVAALRGKAGTGTADASAGGLGKRRKDMAVL
jgi:hypothetical protein